MLHVYSEEIIANLFVVFKSDIIKSKFIELNSVIKGCLFVNCPELYGQHKKESQGRKY